MKEFKVSCWNCILYLSIFFLIIGTAVLLMGLVAKYTRNGILCLGVIVLAIIVSALIYRSISYQIISVDIGDDGMSIKEKDVSFLWKDIEWYKYLENEGRKTSRLVLKLKDGEKVNLYFLKMSQFEKDRKDLVSLVLKNIELNGKNSRSFYNSTAWMYVAHLLIVSYVVGPFLVFYFDADVKKLIAPFFIYIGSTLPLIITIYSNRKRK